jgi:anaerobic magnesium-protoporphyrin IX monomethyl ester cyclase
MVDVILIKASNVTPRNASVVPPLGILSLSGWLRKRLGVRVGVIDTQVEPLIAGLDRLRVTSGPPLLYGISALTWERESLADIAATLRERHAGIPVVVGGPHASSYPESVLALPGVSALVEREGEVVLQTIVEGLREGSGLRDIPGVHYLDDDGQHVKSERPPFIEDQDDLPFLDFSEVPLHRYRQHKSFSQLGPRPTLPLMTSRACPFKCTYCHIFFGKGFRPMTAERVLDELAWQIEQTGIRDFEIVDDIFNFDYRRARRILNGIIERGLDVRLSFPNGLRGDLLKVEDIPLYRRAGTASYAIAIETVTERIQREIQKDLKLDKIHDIIAASARARIFTTGFFMLGFPGESRSEIQDTIDFAVTSDLHLGLFNIVTPFAGTEMGDQHAEQAATVLDKNIGRDAFSLPEVSDTALQGFQRGAYRRFYANPRRVARILRDHPVPRNLPKMGFSFMMHRAAG